MSVRLRIATYGHRGTTTNRRISIATFGYRPFGELVETVWKDIIRLSLNIQRMYSVILER